MQNYIDFKTTQQEIDRCKTFLEQYKNENFTSLVKKSIRRAYTSLILNKSCKFYDATPLELGKEKGPTARISSYMSEIVNDLCFKTGINRSQFLRQAIGFYIQESKPEPIKVLDIEQGKFILEEEY